MVKRGFKGRRARLLGGCKLAAIGVALSTSSAAIAQDDPPASGQQASQEQTVVVTGSRIAREGFDASTPVSVVDALDIQLSGRANVEDVLNDTPQFIPSTNGGSTGNTVPGGTADLNLRGFGATRNLVLVNGRRFAISGPEGVTDINTIPSALIGRTEIVTGGSSAVYGSDASPRRQLHHARRLRRRRGARAGRHRQRDGDAQQDLRPHLRYQLRR
jgi:outer membrane cobalamin receptor